jgi:hypothetical protein
MVAQTKENERDLDDEGGSTRARHKVSGFHYLWSGEKPSAVCAFKLADRGGPLVAFLLKAEIYCPFDTRFALLRMRGLNRESCSSDANT